MQTRDLLPVFRASGPFATALVDVSRDNETGEHDHDLLVRRALDRLAEEGAPEEVRDAVVDRLSALVHRPSPVARLVVANTDGVLYDELAGVRVDSPVASYDALPDLIAWITHRDSSVEFVLAVVDHVGGDVAVYTSDVPEPEEETSAGGETEHVHKVPVGGWSALRYQHVTENVWAQNAKAVAEEVTRHVSRGQRLVLLAGDPQSKSMVRESLGELPATVVELKSGQRTEDGGDEAMQQAIREELLEHAVQRRLRLVHELRERTGRGEAVATGVAHVADALVRGQVDTLLLAPDGVAHERLDPASHPGLVVGTDVPDGPLRADRALVAAAVLTGAEVSVVPAGALDAHGVAALLRWDQEARGGSL